MSGHGTPIPMTARAGNPLKGIAMRVSPNW